MKIIVAGDYYPRARVARLFDQGDYAAVLGYIKPIVSKADYAIANFECAVCKGGEQPLEKFGPNIKCGVSGVEALKWAGFHCVTLANNHFLDYGERGVENTLEACQKHALDTVGGGKDLQAASSVLYKTVGSKTLAVINCCEHEFSIATEHTAGSNPLNPIAQYYDIIEARGKADYVLVIVHGGHELWQLPSPRMKQTYQFFIDAGADAVVNHHQHCFSGYEYYKGKPIVYGLGNFCFDRQHFYEGLWEYGYMAEIDTATNALTLFPYEQCKGQPTVRLMDDRQEFYEQIGKLNAIIADNGRLKEAANSYYSQQKRRFAMPLQPYSNNFLRKLFKKGILPSLVSKKRELFLADRIMMESHRDILVHTLTHHDE